MTAWFVASVGIKPVRYRTWRFFLTKEEALTYIRDNTFLLAEGSFYTYAVIEAHQPGLDAVDEEHWFKLSDDKATPCSKPPEFQGVGHFCLG